MASAGTFCDETHVALAAGNKMSVDIDNGDTAETDVWIVDAECVICCITRYNWLDAYAGLNVDVKYILRQTAASMAAIEAVKYDTSGWSSQIAAEDAITVLRDIVNRNLMILKDIKTQTFMIGA